MYSKEFVVKYHQRKTSVSADPVKVRYRIELVAAYLVLCLTLLPGWYWTFLAFPFKIFYEFLDFLPIRANLSRRPIIGHK